MNGSVCISGIQMTFITLSHNERARCKSNITSQQPEMATLVISGHLFFCVWLIIPLLAFV